MSSSRRSRPSTENWLSEQVRPVIEGANVPPAKWNGQGDVTKPGYRMMLNGGCVEITYVVKDDLAKHAAETDRLMAILRSHFDGKTLEFDGRRWRTSVRRKYARPEWSDLYVEIRWLSDL